MIPGFDKIHNRFRFNGHFFDREELKEVAYSLVKEGEPYEQILGDFLIDWLNDRPWLEVQTSGSTGKRKIIRLHKQHMVNSSIASGDFFNISIGNTALHCLPAQYIAGRMMVVRAMILGLELDFVPPSSRPLEGLDKIYDFTAMIPLQLQNSLSQMHKVKKLIVGGAAVNKNLVDAIQPLNTKIFETYGMTETVTHVAAKKLNQFASETEVGKAVFKTLPGINIDTDVRGCIRIDAGHLANEIVVTNDLVNIISDTEFEWLGRIDNIVNSGGIKLVPEELEKKVTALIKPRFFMAGTPDHNLGESLTLFVEGIASNQPDYLHLITESGLLKKHENPKIIYYIDAFALTENGKIIRKESLEKAGFTS